MINLSRGNEKGSEEKVLSFTLSRKTEKRREQKNQD